MKRLLLKSIPLLFTLVVLSGCDKIFGESEIVGKFFLGDVYPQSISFSGPREIASSACTEFSITLTRDDGKAPTKQMTFVPEADALPPLYADSACGTSIRSLVVPAGTMEMKFYVKGTSSGSWSVPFAMDGARDIGATWTATFILPASEEEEEVVLTLSSISPVIGTTAGGTTVTLTGTGFSIGATVNVDGSPCTSVSVVSSTQVTCVTPVHSSGAVNIAVTTASLGTATLASAFTYFAGPALTSVSPSTGLLAGGTSITVTGVRFTANSVLSVGANGAACTVASATQMNCVTPAGASTGAVSFTVTDEHAQASSLADAFTYYVVPTFTSITPAIGPAGGGQSVTITGTNLSAATVKIGGNVCTGSGADTTYTCLTPAHAAGAVTILIEVGGQSATASNAYTYVSGPTITSLTSDRGSVSGSSVVVNGLGFTADCAISAGQTAWSCSYVSSTRMNCTAPPVEHYGPVDLTITNNLGQSSTHLNAFTYYVDISITSITPSRGPTSGGELLTVVGANLADVVVTYDHQECVGSGDDTTFTCVMPPHAVGDVYPYFQVGVAQATTSIPYTYVAPPTISYVTPSAAPVAGGTTISIYGTDFTAETEISADGVPWSCTTGGNPITCVTPAASAGPVALKVTDKWGKFTTNSSAFAFELVPTFTGISPSSGPIAGGQTVTITGTNLSGATFIIGGSPCVGSGTATSFTCATTSHSSGTFDVVISAGSQSATGAGAYAYAAIPILYSINQSSGPIAGGTAVTFAGAGLLPSVVVATVGGSAWNCSGGAGSSISCTSPASATATTVEVSVTDEFGQTTTLSNAFTYYLVPTFASIFPTTGSSAGGQTVVITGTQFDNTMTAAIGGVSCPGSLQNGNFVCTTPIHSAGLVDVRLDLGSQSTSAANSYTYVAAPTVTSVNPTTLELTGGTVTIAGTGFTDQVTFAATGETSWLCTIDSPAQARCTAPASSARTVSITATDPFAQSGTLPNALTYVLPTPVFSSITPTFGPLAGGQTVTIAGSNLTDVYVYVGFDLCTSGSGTDTEYTCVMPAHASGIVDLVLSNGRTITARDAYTYKAAPTVSSVTPNHGPTSGGTSVTVNGTGFHASSTVSVLGTGWTCSYVDSTRMDCTTSSWLTDGAVGVRASDQFNQTGTGIDAFYYQAPPTITSITPGIAVEEGATTITIEGNYFQSGVTVAFGLSSCNVTWSTTTMLTCLAPAHGLGATSVTITNPDGQTSSGSDSIYYVPNVPTVTGISPAIGAAGGTQAVTVSGTKFFANNLDVQIGGQSMTNIQFMSSTTITGNVPALAAGTYDVTVSDYGTNYSYSTTLTGGYTARPAPNVTSISPSIGSIRGGTTVTIWVSAGLYSGEMAVTIGSTVCGSVTVGFQTITCVTGVAAASVADVVVTNTTDGTSGTLSASYTYRDAPTVTSVSPSYGRTSGATSVTIEGTNFAEDATVSFGVTPGTSVTILSGTLLTVSSPAHDEGTFDVVVTNPDGLYGGATNAFTFQAAPTITSLSPGVISPSANVNVEITGTGFQAGASSWQCIGITYNSPTSVTCLTISMSAGVTSFAITNPDGQISTSVDWNVHYPPLPNFIAPTGGLIAGGTTLTITGFYLDRTTSILVGGAACTSVSAGETSATCTVPPLANPPAAGLDGTYSTVSVKLIDFWGRESELSNVYTYAEPPQVTSISPDFVTSVSSQNITISGQYFRGSNVSVSTASSLSCNLVSSTEITCSVMAAADTWPTVTVTNSDSQSATLSNGVFFYGAPTISSMSHSVVTSGGGTTVTIDGTNIAEGVTVAVGATTATSTWISKTRLEFITPPTAAGSVSVVVRNPDALSASTSLSFQDAPDITAITPDRVHVNGGMALTLTGTFTAGSTAAVGGNDCAVTSLTATTIKCIAPAEPTLTAHSDEIVVTDITQTTDSIGFQYATSEVWRPLPSAGAPQGQFSTPVWTGTEMITWSGGAAPNNGGRFTPGSNAWTGMATIDAPAARTGHTVAWNGTYFVVFGGQTQDGYSNTTHLYYPPLDVWSTPETECPLSPRSDTIAARSGDRILLWGGRNASGWLNDGAIFNADGTWEMMGTTGTAPPALDSPSGTLVGTEFIVWGGKEDVTLSSNGYRYDMVSTWTATPSLGQPAARYVHNAIEMGNSLFIIGGWAGGHLSSVGVLDLGGGWTEGPTLPTGRYQSASAADQTHIYVYGGNSYEGIRNDGYVFTSGGLNWNALPAGGPGYLSTLGGVMGNAEFIVWGNDNTSNLGSRYIP